MVVVVIMVVMVMVMVMVMMMMMMMMMMMNARVVSTGSLDDGRWLCQDDAGSRGPHQSEKIGLLHLNSYHLVSSCPVGDAAAFPGAHTAMVFPGALKLVGLPKEDIPLLVRLLGNEENLTPEAVRT
jgi:hypothetical protein